MRTVVLVVDPSFGERARALAPQVPLWLVRSPANDEYALAYRPATYVWPKSGESAQQAAIRIAKRIDEHHQAETLELYGVSAAPELLESLRPLGFAGMTPCGEFVRLTKACELV